MEQQLNQKKKCLLLSVINFLTNELQLSDMSEDHKESLDVAVQCMETAYGLTPDIKQQLAKHTVDLLALINVPSDSQQSDMTTQAELHKNLGNSAMKDGRYKDAVDEYSAAINCNPNNAVYYCNRAAAYSRLDKHHEAIKDSKEAIRLDPAYGKAYGRLGIAYSNLAMFVEARQAYATALIYDPHNAMYETNLKLAQERLNEQLGGGGGNVNNAPQQQQPAAPTGPGGVPFDLGQMLNNESFTQMAREMLNNPEFGNMMNRVMSLGGQAPGAAGDFNIESLLQAGQSLASRMEHQDPNFVENLRQQFSQSTASNNQPAAAPDADSDTKDDVVKDNSKDSAM